MVSGVREKLSYSFGQFHYETDGFRENNDQERDIYNAFVQTSLSDRTSLHAELRRSDLQSGDLTRSFDPDHFSDTERRSEITNSARFGFHHAFTARSEVIGSVVYRDRHSETNVIPQVVEFDTEENGYIAEVQHLFQTGRVQWTMGGGRFSENRTDETLIGFPPAQVEESETQHSNLYLYSLINYPVDITWVVGASGDFLQGRNQFNPKFGLIWSSFASTRVRAAAFRVLKRTLISSMTLGPTQVGGFNQFFDERLSRS